MKRVHLVVLFLCAAWLLSGAVFGPGGTASALASPTPGDEAIAITGRVTDALTGAPLPGIEVHAGYWYDEWRGRIWEWISTTTDEQGQYLITVLWAGTWPVYFSDPQARYLTTLHVQVPVGAGQTVTNIDARLELSGHLAGRVTDMVDREPVNGVCVDLYGAGDFAHLKRVYTDAAGHYEVSDLSTGRYLLSFWHPLNYYLPEYYADVQQIDGATPVTVTQGLTTTVNVELLPQGGVGGQVTDAAGDPLGGIDVWATCPVRDAPACSGEAVTDAAGRYAIRILNKDRRFHVVFSDPIGRFASVRYPGTPFWGQAALVPVGPGLLTRGIDAVLPVGGEIRGRP